MHSDSVASGVTRFCPSGDNQQDTVAPCIHWLLCLSIHFSFPPRGAPLIRPSAALEVEVAGGHIVLDVVFVSWGNVVERWVSVSGQ